MIRAYLSRARRNRAHRRLLLAQIDAALAPEYRRLTVTERMRGVR